MINKSNIKFYIIIIVIFIFNIYNLYLTDYGYDEKIKYLIKISVKGKVSKLVHSKVLFFQIDNKEGNFYAPVSIFHKITCENCNKDEIEKFKIQIGDSIIKEKNSRIVTFKRGHKIFKQKLSVGVQNLW